MIYAPWFRKRGLVIVLVALLLVSLAAFSAVAGQNSVVNVTVNGQKVIFPDQKPFLDSASGRTFVPLRFASEALGCRVTWDGDNNQAVIEKGSNTIKMGVGSATPVVNGNNASLDAPARLQIGRIMVPLRFISECLGASVQWDGANDTVIIVDAPVIESGGENGDGSVFDEVYGS